jgi:hypothetical protein
MYLKFISFLLGFKIFNAEDLTLNGKSTYLLFIVKSSNIITGKFLKIPSVSVVYPKMKDLLAVKTGTDLSEYGKISFAIYLLGCS